MGHADRLPWVPEATRNCDRTILNADQPRSFISQHPWTVSHADGIKIDCLCLVMMFPLHNAATVVSGRFFRIDRSCRLMASAWTSFRNFSQEIVPSRLSSRFRPHPAQFTSQLSGCGVGHSRGSPRHHIASQNWHDCFTSRCGRARPPRALDRLAIRRARGPRLKGLGDLASEG